jgi:hypothetical protein
MPVHPVKKNGKTIGYRYGHPGHGHKIFKTKGAAKKQAMAINLSKARSKGYPVPGRGRVHK